MEVIQAAYPVLGRGYFAKRVLKYMAIHALAYPLPYGAFVRWVTALGKDYDQIINMSTKGFPPGEGFFPAIRKQLSTPGLAMLERRVRQYDPTSVARRAAFRSAAAALLPATVEHPGRLAGAH